MRLFASSYENVKTNVRHRGLISDLIRREFKIRYLGSMLGSYWNFVHPIAMIAIYTFVFSKIFQVRLGKSEFDSPYAFTLYLCAGMFPWSSFNEMIMRSTVAFQEHAGLVKKIRFPQEVLPTIAAGTAFITLALSFLVYGVLLLGSGHGISSAIVLLPLVIVLQLIFASGIGMALSAFNVFFRDIQQVLPIIFQLWFWATPLVYTTERVPEAYRFILYLNPFYYFSACYQAILFYKAWPSKELLASAGLVALLSYAIGATIFAHFKSEILDEL